MGWKEEMTAGVVADIQRERERQKEAEGWTPEHDAAHDNGEMARASACYALNAFCQLSANMRMLLWPWSDQWWKPKNVRRDLVRAAALLVAEIERHDIERLERDGPNVAQPWAR